MSSVALASFRSVARRSVRAVSRSRCAFLHRFTDPRARRTGCDYSETWSATRARNSLHRSSMTRHSKADYQTNKQRLTCGSRFRGSEETHSSTRVLTFSTSTSKAPSPDIVATICKYSAITGGEEARASSSHHAISSANQSGYSCDTVSAVSFCGRCELL